VARTIGKLLLLSSALALAVLAVWTFGQPQRVGQAFQEPILVGIDADPAGNTATSLGTTDACVSVNSGDTFDMDIVISNITDLAGWQLTLTYDPAVLIMNDANVDLFITATEGSRLADLSATVPDSSGAHTFIVADLGSVSENGSGTLARMTLQAVGTGSSALVAEQVILGDSAATAIGDVDGDSFFDGTVTPAFVYVDAPCPEELPTMTPSATLEVTPPPEAATPEVTTPVATVAPSPAGTTAPTATGPEGQAEGSGGDSIPWPAVAGGAVAATVAALVAGLWVRRTMRRSP